MSGCERAGPSTPSAVTPRSWKRAGKRYPASLRPERIQHRVLDRGAGREPPGKQGDRGREHYAPERREPGEVVNEDVADEDAEVDAHPEERGADAERDAEHGTRHPDQPRFQ